MEQCRWGAHCNWCDIDAECACSAAQMAEEIIVKAGVCDPNPEMAYDTALPNTADALRCQPVSSSSEASQM